MTRSVTVVLVTVLLGGVARADDRPKKGAEPLSPQSKEWKELKAEWRRLNTAGLDAYQQGDGKKAQEAFEKALATARRLYPTDDFPDGHDNLVQSLNNMAILLQDSGKPADAEPLYRDVLAMNRRLYPKQDHPHVAQSLNNLASALQALGRAADAEPLYRDALAMRQRLYPMGDHPDLGQSLNNLASALQALGRAADAEPLYRDALAMRQRLYPKQDHPAVAYSMNNLAAVLESLGRGADAEPLYRDALTMRQRLYPKQDHPAVGNSLHNLAAVLQSLGRPADAEPLLRDALAMHRRLYPNRDHPHVALGLSNLAFAVRELGRPSDAEPLLRDALAMRQRLYPKRDHPHVAESMNNLASVLKELGKDSDAERLYRDALAMRQRLYPKRDHPHVAESLNNVASVLVSQGNAVEAEPLLRDALAMHRRLYPNRDHPHVALGLSNLAFAVRELGRPSDAEPLLRDALAMDQRLYPKRDHPHVARSLGALAELLHVLGRPADAEPLARDALAMFRRLAASVAGRKGEGDALSYTASLPLCRDGYLSCVATERPAGAAYAEVFADRSHVARIYEQRQLQARAAASDPKSARLLAELADARMRRAELLLAPATGDEPTLKKRNEDIEGYEAVVRVKSEALSKGFAPVARVEKLARATPADLQKALPDGAVVVDYLRWVHFEYDPKTPGEDGEKRTEKYLAFVVTKTDVKWVDLDTAAKVEPAVAAWRAAVTANDPKAAELGAAVRELVWAKVRKELPAGTKTVYLCPDRDLCRLPFAALPGDQPGTVLLDDFAVATIPHAPFLLDQLWGQDTSTETDLLVVGGVDFDAKPATPADPKGQPGPLLHPKAKPWAALPQTKAEADALAARGAKGKWTTTLLSGADATPAAVRAALPKARVAHLATHGFFADRQFRSAFQLDEKDYRIGFRNERVGRAANSPLVMTGLVLAGANDPKTPGRGILTGEALVDLDLSGLDLAVLSACETGLGDVAGGEGTFGLQRAFHYAGTRDVVASLWKVDDAATAALMGEFYRQLWELNQPPIEALRQAQLAVYRADGKRFAALAKRGFGAGDKDLSKLPVAADAKGGTPPALWAAFTLSGPGR